MSPPVYTKADADRFRALGDITEGVSFDWGLASAAGAWFILLREPHHTDADIEKAKAKLKSNRDVVGRIQVERVGP